MSLLGGAVRDDRSWPRGAGVFSALVVLASAVAFAWALATASQGRAGVPVVAGGFVTMLAASVWVFRHSFRALLDGGRQPGRAVIGQLVLVAVGFVAMGYDPHLGAALLAALFGGMFAVN